MKPPRTTIVFSDIHWTTSEGPDPRRPLWRRFKQPDLFPDADIAAMLDAAAAEAQGPLEIVLNGDVFDFDAVTELPPPDDGIPLSWWERLRGMAPEEVKSAWKLDRILDDHPVLVDTLRARLAAGDRLVFVIGNHDMELHWPACQRVLHDRLAPHPDADLRVCAWFYVSHGDTLIEHGNQYDGYCLCLDPLAPLVRAPTTGIARVRLPFGNWASRMMLNGMGMFNPHADAAWQLTFWGYVDFFWRHVARSQPFLLWTWLWGATATFLASLRDGLLPAEQDVLRLDAHVSQVARTSQTTPRVVRGLAALRVHPAIFQPWMVLKELWLDRAMLLLVVFAGSFQVLATINVFVGLSAWWWIVLLVLFLGPFLLYAQRVDSEIHQLERHVRRKVPLIARLAGVRRVVFGHSHRERHTHVEGVELLNPGTWSPAFADVACTQRVGRPCVVRVVPQPEGPRSARLDAWTGVAFERIEETALPPMPLLPRPGQAARAREPALSGSGSPTSR